jgi:hypothetical protein
MMNYRHRAEKRNPNHFDERDGLGLTSPHIPTTDPQDPPIPLADLDEEAASLARHCGCIRRGLGGEDVVTPDELEMIRAELLHVRRTEGGSK